MKTLFMQEVFKRGVLAFGTHNMSYAHTAADLDLLASVYDEVFGLVAQGLRTGIAPMLRCDVLVPLFKVR
jgi:hypothetical protein